MPHFTLFQWLLAVVGGLGVGISKSGFVGVTLVVAALFGDKACGQLRRQTMAPASC